MENDTLLLCFERCNKVLIEALVGTMCIGKERPRQHSHELL